MDLGVGVHVIILDLVALPLDHKACDGQGRRKTRQPRRTRGDLGLEYSLPSAVLLRLRVVAITPTWIVVVSPRGLV